jgi:polyribonucleotide nucleotidyltransferase
MLFLKMYPRAAIDVFIQVLEADGGSRCASATVAALALADAGIPMRGLVAGVAAGKIDGKIAVDLSDIEDKIGDADVPTVMAPERGEITLLQMDGKLTKKELTTALQMAEEGIHQIHEMQKEVLFKKYAKIREQITEVSPKPSKKEEEAKDEKPKPTRKRTKRTTSEKAEDKPKTTKKTKTPKKKKTGSPKVKE